MTAVGEPNGAEPLAPWCRPVLIAAALIELLGAINDFPILFGDTSEIPGPGIGGAIIGAKIALKPFAAIAALYCAATGRIRHALVAMAIIILLTWLSFLPSVAIHGLDFEGSAWAVLNMVFQILLAPFLAAQVGALALVNRRIEFATALAVLPTLIGILGVAAFGIGVAIYGF
jgi:hypothetical protein